MSVYPGGWEKQRKKALERDGYECVSCGVSQSELGRHKKLHVHHKLPVSVFEDHFGEDVPWELVHHVSNLVSLCNTCHHTAERMSVPHFGMSLDPETKERYMSMKSWNQTDSEFINELLDIAEGEVSDSAVTDDQKIRSYHEVQHDMRDMIRSELEQFGRRYLE